MGAAVGSQIADKILAAVHSYLPLSGLPVATIPQLLSLDHSLLTAEQEKQAVKLTQAARAAFMSGWCAEKNNAWLGESLQKEEWDSEQHRLLGLNFYDGKGKLWECACRMCPSAQATLRRRSRKKAQIGLNVQRLPGERWRLITLTGPAMANLSLLDSIALMNGAWREMTNRRDWFASLVRGGIKTIEFTLGEQHEREGRDWTPADGYHTHIHALAIGTFLDQYVLSIEWAECLKVAWRKLKRGRADLESISAPDFSANEGRAVVDVREVKGDTTGRADKEKSTVGQRDAISEVTKYVTKADTWLKLPDLALIEAAAVQRWNRMFEVFGCCGVAVREAKRQEAENKEKELSGSTTSLDTPDLSDGKLPLAERQFRGMYTEFIEAWRDWLAERHPEWGLQGWGDIAHRYCDKILDGLLENRCKKLVGLRSLPYSMPIENWIESMLVRSVSAQMYRKYQLTVHHPVATFRTLAGETWDAESIRLQEREERQKFQSLFSVKENQNENIISPDGRNENIISTDDKMGVTGGNGYGF